MAGILHVKFSTRVKVFLYDLTLSYNTSVTDDGRTDTDGRTTTVPVPRPLLKYGGLKLQNSSSPIYMQPCRYRVQ